MPGLRRPARTSYGRIPPKEHPYDRREPGRKERTRIVQFVQDGADSRLPPVGSRNPAGWPERCREAVGRETKCPYSG